MAVLPIISAQKQPWNNTRELGISCLVNGVWIDGVPSFDAVTGDIIFGSAGLEGSDPYLLVESSDISTLGDLHGKTVVVGELNFVVRNVRPKKTTNLTRLVLDAR